jgi:hypothetical protein
MVSLVRIRVKVKKNGWLGFIVYYFQWCEDDGLDLFPCVPR